MHGKVHSKCESSLNILIFKTLENIVSIFVTFKLMITDYLINFKFDNMPILNSV